MGTQAAPAPGSGSPTGLNLAALPKGFNRGHVSWREGRAYAFLIPALTGTSCPEPLGWGMEVLLAKATICQSPLVIQNCMHLRATQSSVGPRGPQGHCR